jgi:hypothetical protein
MFKKALICIFLLSSQILFAQGEFKGVSVSGAIGLSGVLKKLVIPSALPLGSILGTYGYEVWDFSQFKKNNDNKNRASYCFSSLELVYDFSLLGISFGGEAAEAYLAGKCDRRKETHIGEDLFFAIAYTPGKGSKAGAIGIALNHGFNMSKYVDELTYQFNGYPISKLKPHQRLFRLHKHILKYIALKNRHKFESTTQKLLLKLFTLPALLVSPYGKSIKSLFNFSDEEISVLSELKKKRPDSLRDIILGAFEIMRRDPAFYFFSKEYDSEETFIDFLRYYEVLDHSLEECHSINIYAGASSRFAFDLFPEMKVDVSLGYSVTEHDKSYNSDWSTKALAVKDFAAHNFVKHSATCENASTKSGTNFGRFLGLWGYSQKK